MTHAQSNPGMRVLVAGTENILDNMYWGNQRSMLITCCIFRLGGVAALLSNRRADTRRAKYRLEHLVRTHLGASDEAYKCAACSAMSFSTLYCKLYNLMQSVSLVTLFKQVTCS